jgi:hypothetical protein
MLIDLSDKQTLEVNIEYGTASIPLGKHKSLHYGKTTNVRMKLLKGKKKLKNESIGIAICGPKDEFKKITGIKHAARRALENLKLKKKDKLLVWESILPIHLFKNDP